MNICRDCPGSASCLPWGSGRASRWVDRASVGGQPHDRHTRVTDGGIGEPHTVRRHQWAMWVFRISPKETDKTEMCEGMSEGTGEPPGDISLLTASEKASLHPVHLHSRHAWPDH